MAGVYLYSLNAAGNKAIVGTIDWRENIYMPSQINDNVAQIMADMRALVNSIGIGWIEIGDGDGVYTATYVSATSFQFSGLDVTAYYRAGMRVRVVAPTPGTIAGTITAVTFSANTVITVAWDSGSLSNEAITSVSIGVGSGDTGAAGNTLTRVASQCRMVWASNSVVRLDRCNGMYLTIDNVAQPIPAAGVTYDHSAFADGAWYIYAYMSGAVMTLVASTTAYVVDPRNGLLVLSGQPYMTYVGCINRFSGAAEDSETVRHVSTYYNRYPRTMQYSQTNSTASGSNVPLHNPIRWICQAFSPIHITFSGYMVNNTATNTSVCSIMISGGIAGGGQLTSNLGASVYIPVSTNYTRPINGGITAENAQMGGNVTGGQMTLTGQINAIVH